MLVGMLMYLLILAVYMQPVITNGCNETHLGGPGDQSAFTWLYAASPNSPPLWGNTTWTNAPYGENLSEPVYITGLAQYTSIWVMQKAVGPTCALNIYTSFGFIFSASVMFIFTLWLTKRRNYFVAWFAGYLLAFSPYIQLKTLHHVSYVYVGLLVILLWLLIAYWRRPSMKVASTFMVVLASLFYHDPYFIMLAGFLLISVTIATIIYHCLYQHISLREIGRKVRPLLISLPIFILLISPVIYVRLTQSALIESAVSSSRAENIMNEGIAYGARPWEYLLPAATNPLTPNWLKSFQLSHQHGTTVTETTLFLGYVTLGLAGVYVTRWLKTARRIKRREARETHHVTLVAGCITIVGALMSMPPYFHVGSLTIYLPSWLLLSVTTMWRVPARFVVIVQLGLIILATFGLLYLLDRFKVQLRGRRVFLLYAMLIGLSFIEYSTFNPFSREYWTYAMTPSVYDEIKDSDAVDRIAEYPMLEPPRDDVYIYYLSYQSYHRKSMINTAKADSANKKYRESLADINDWQTAGVLKELGVDRVVVHSNDTGIRTTSLVKKSTSYDTKMGVAVSSYIISDSTVQKSYALTISDGFDGPSNYGFTDIDFFMHQSGVLQPILLPNATKQSVASARIEYYAFEKTPRKVVFEQAGKELAVVYGKEAKQVVEFTLDPNKPIHIVPDNAPTDYSFVISNMEVK